LLFPPLQLLKLRINRNNAVKGGATSFFQGKGIGVKSLTRSTEGTVGPAAPPPHLLRIQAPLRLPQYSGFDVRSFEYLARNYRLHPPLKDLALHNAKVCFMILFSYSFSC
jgi:hypothetical protein